MLIYPLVMTNIAIEDIAAMAKEIVSFPTKNNDSP